MRDGATSARGGKVMVETEDRGFTRAGKGKERDPSLQPPKGTNPANSLI